jgi:hypothetical protein
MATNTNDTQSRDRAGARVAANPNAKTAGLQRTGFDAEAHRIPTAATSDGKGQGTPLIDPVADDQAPHQTDVGWYDISSKFDALGVHRYAGATDDGFSQHKNKQFGFDPTPPGRENLRGATDNPDTPTTGVLFTGRPGNADKILD